MNPKEEIVKLIEDNQEKGESKIIYEIRTRVIMTAYHAKINISGTRAKNAIVEFFSQFFQGFQ